MNRITLLSILLDKFPDLQDEDQSGGYLSVHIQLAAGATGKVAVELYRGLTGQVSESWGITIPRHTTPRQLTLPGTRGMFIFLVAREGGKVDTGWTYDVYTLEHLSSSQSTHTLAVTNDGDRLVRLFDVDTLYRVGDIVLNLPGYTPQG